MAEQRYQAVLAVIADGRSVTEVAGQWRVSRKTVNAWLARYEAEGLAGLADRSHRPVCCPHQLGADLEAARAFYGGVLACPEGRSSEAWIDFDFFGHQIVAHLDPGTRRTGRCG